MSSTQASGTTTSVRALAMIAVINAIVIAVALFLAQSMSGSAEPAAEGAVEEVVEADEEGEESESTEDAGGEGGSAVLILLWIGAAAASAFGTKYALGQTLGNPNDLEGTIQSIERGDLRISTGSSDNLVTRVQVQLNEALQSVRTLIESTDSTVVRLLDSVRTLGSASEQLMGDASSSSEEVKTCRPLLPVSKRWGRILKRSPRMPDRRRVSLNRR